MTSFLIANIGGKTIWAAVDPDCLCTAPGVTDRRFTAFLSPFKSEAEARAALTDAGADEIAKWAK